MPLQHLVCLISRRGHQRFYYVVTTAGLHTVIFPNKYAFIALAYCMSIYISLLVRNFGLSFSKR